MVSNTETLKEWIIQYMKHRDVFLKNITGISQGNPDNEIIIEYKDKKQLIIVVPVLFDIDKVMDNIRAASGDSLILVVYNSRENLDIVTDYWHKLSVFQNLAIYFVNPASQTETRWIIHPHTHSRVADSDSLKTGLKSMYSTVEPVKVSVLKKA